MKALVLLETCSEKHVSILCWTIAAVQSFEGLHAASFTGTGPLNLTLRQLVLHFYYSLFNIVQFN